jgi:hypothetical protein
MQAGSNPAYAKGIGAKDGVRLPGGHLRFSARDRSSAQGACECAPVACERGCTPNETLQLPGAEIMEVVVAAALAPLVSRRHLPRH